MNPKTRLRLQAQRWRQRYMGDPSRYRAGYLRFILRSPHHMCAMLEAERFMRRLSQLKLRDEWSPPSNVVHLPVAARAPRREPPPRRPSRGQLMAAALGALTVSAILLLAVGAAPMRPITTGAGEWRQHRLQEGSSIHLGPNTAVQLRLAEDRREVKLLRGEAYFEVTRDTRRPFVVDTPVGQVQVLGTSFGVQSREDAVLVAVLKGRVAVQPLALGAAEQPPPAVELRPNDRAHLTRAGVQRLAPLPAEEVLAWVNKRLIVRNMSFGKIAEELNRRHHQQIRIHDPELARTHVAYLDVDLDRPEALVEVMRRWRAEARVELADPVAVAP